MRVFFKKMGIDKVRFKPAYNPYTEVLYRNEDVIPYTDPGLFIALPRDLCLPPYAR